MSLIHKVSDIFKNRNGLTAKHESWEEVEIDKICTLQNGYALKSKQFNKNGDGIPIIRIRDISHSKPETYFSGDFPKEYLVKKGDLLIGMDGDFNAEIWFGPAAILNQRVCRVFPIKKFINPKFLYYGIQGYLNEINANTSSTTVKHLSSKSIKEIPFPLPPLPEQDRIVANVDILMAQVETMQKSLERIPQLLKDFRQQVLTQAVTGKLTEDWREGKELSIPLLENNKKYELAFKFEHPKEWDIYPIGNIFNFQQGMQIAKNTRLKEQRENTLPILRIKNYHDGFIKDVEYVEITEKSLIAETDDIILTRTGESRGWVLTGFRGVFHNNTFRINFPQDKIEGRFIKIVLDSRQTQNFIKSNSGRTGQPDLSHKSFGPCPFIIPSLEEQKEIISQVESLINSADFIEEKYKALKTKIDTLPQAILHKAFKGELVEQLPTDGDARELLREIEGLKGTMKPKKTKTFSIEEETLGQVAEQRATYLK